MWSRASGTSALKQLPSRYSSLHPTPSSSVYFSDSPPVPELSLLLPPKPKPQRSLISVRELSLHTLTVGSEA